MSLTVRCASCPTGAVACWTRGLPDTRVVRVRQAALRCQRRPTRADRPLSCWGSRRAFAAQCKGQGAIGRPARRAHVLGRCARSFTRALWLSGRNQAPPKKTDAGSLSCWRARRLIFVTQCVVGGVIGPLARQARLLAGCTGWLTSALCVFSAQLNADASGRLAPTVLSRAGDPAASSARKVAFKKC